jgi:prolipoprotein diacylglyceryl transferase
MTRSFIPSPPISALRLGPLTIHMYALAIITGIVVAVWLGDRRWRERGGYRGEVADVAVWAVPFGIVGGRLYHLITDPELYFTHGQDPWRAFAIWDGGLGIWGAVALGALGAWIGCRRHDIRLPPFADAIAPAIALAQGIGRIGNWFNRELFGAPTTLPWAVHITHASDGSPPRPGLLTSVRERDRSRS